MEQEILNRYDEIVQAVREMSPLAWDAMIWKLQVDGALALVWGFVFLGASAVLGLTARKCWLKGEIKNDFWLGCFVSAAGACVALAIGTAAFDVGVSKLLAPEGRIIFSLVK